MDQPGEALRGQTVRDRAAFEALRDPWDALYRAVGAHPFLSHAYLASWAATFGARRRLEVRLLWRGEALVAALPLCSGAVPGALVPMGEGRIGLAGVLAGPEVSEDALARLLRPGAGQFLDLEPLEEAEAARLAEATRSARLGLWRKAVLRAEWVAVRDTFDAWYRARHKSARRQWRRSLEMLEPDGMRRLTEADGAAEAVEGYLEVARGSWKTAAGTGFGAGGAGPAFLRRLAGCAPAGLLSLDVLHHGAQPVAGSFSVRGPGALGRDVLYVIADEFDERFSKGGPGRYMLSRCVLRGYEGGCDAVDYMRSSETTRSLSDETRALHRLVIWRRGDPTVLLRYWPALRRRLVRWRRAGASVRGAALGRLRK